VRHRRLLDLGVREGRATGVVTGGLSLWLSRSGAGKDSGRTTISRLGFIAMAEGLAGAPEAASIGRDAGRRAAVTPIPLEIGRDALRRETEAALPGRDVAPELA